MTDFTAKMYQIWFRLGNAPPDPVAGFEGRFASRGRDWAGEERKGRGMRGKWRWGKGRVQVTVERGPLRALLCRCYFCESCVVVYD